MRSIFAEFRRISILLVSVFCTCVFALDTRAVVDIATGVNFRGSTSGLNVFATPADANGCVGPAHFVEFINGRFAVYLKSTGTKVLDQTDSAFWSNMGINVPSGFDTTDPRLIYDRTVGRWFALQIDYSTTGTDQANRFMLAISVTSDPSAIAC